MNERKEIDPRNIRVTVQREDRLKAITELATAIRFVAHALDNQTMVTISNCTIANNLFGESESAISVDTGEVDPVITTGITVSNKIEKCPEN